MKKRERIDWERIKGLEKGVLTRENSHSTGSKRGCGLIEKKLWAEDR